MGSLQKEAGDLVIQDMEKCKILHMTSVPQSSPASAPATPSQVAEGKGRDWENEELPTVGDQV